MSVCHSLSPDWFSLSGSPCLLWLHLKSEVMMFWKQLSHQFWSDTVLKIMIKWFPARLSNTIWYNTPSHLRIMLVFIYVLIFDQETTLHTVSLNDHHLPCAWPQALTGVAIETGIDSGLAKSSQLLVSSEWCGDNLSDIPWSLMFTVDCY